MLWPVEIATDSHVACAAFLWRLQKRLQLTVAVKATFALQSDSDATVALPVPMGDELVPHLSRCDVTLRGRALGPDETPASAPRLALFRDGKPLIDKTLERVGDRAGFAPLSRSGPARAVLLGALDPRSLEGAVPEIAADVPWARFQAAPADQQIDYLRGGEWLVLDGLPPPVLRLRTRLPIARAEARVRLTDLGGGAKETQLALVADTLALDADRLNGSVVWRGRLEIGDREEALLAISLLAGLSMPGKPVAWNALVLPERTFKLGPAQAEKAARRPIAPFPIEASNRSARRDDNSATPWGGEPPRPVPQVQSEQTISLHPGGAPDWPSPPVREALVAPPAPSPPSAHPASPEAVASQAPSAPPGLAGRLENAGATAEDIAALLSAIRWPRPDGAAPS